MDGQTPKDRKTLFGRVFEFLTPSFIRKEDEQQPVPDSTTTNNIDSRHNTHRISIPGPSTRHTSGTNSLKRLEQFTLASENKGLCLKHADTVETPLLKRRHEPVTPDKKPPDSSAKKQRLENDRPSVTERVLMSELNMPQSRAGWLRNTSVVSDPLITSFRSDSSFASTILGTDLNSSALYPGRTRFGGALNLKSRLNSSTISRVRRDFSTRLNTSSPTSETSKYLLRLNDSFNKSKDSSMLSISKSKPAEPTLRMPRIPYMPPSASKQIPTRRLQDVVRKTSQIHYVPYPTRAKVNDDIMGNGHGKVKSFGKDAQAQTRPLEQLDLPTIRMPRIQTAPEFTFAPAIDVAKEKSKTPSRCTSANISSASSTKSQSDEETDFVVPAANFKQKNKEAEKMDISRDSPLKMKPVVDKKKPTFKLDQEVVDKAGTFTPEPPKEREKKELEKERQTTQKHPVVLNDKQAIHITPVTTVNFLPSISSTSTNSTFRTLKRGNAEKPAAKDEATEKASVKFPLDLNKFTPKPSLPKLDGWTCKSCLSRNSKGAPKCFCCGVPNPALKPKVVPPVAAALTGGSKAPSLSGNFTFSSAAKSTSEQPKAATTLLTSSVSLSSTVTSSAPSSSGSSSILSLGGSAVPSLGGSSIPSTFPTVFPTVFATPASSAPVKPFGFETSVSSASSTTSVTATVTSSDPAKPFQFSFARASTNTTAVKPSDVAEVKPFSGFNFQPKSSAEVAPKTTEPASQPLPSFSFKPSLTSTTSSLFTSSSSMPAFNFAPKNDDSSPSARKRRASDDNDISFQSPPKVGAATGNLFTFGGVNASAPPKDFKPTFGSSFAPPSSSTSGTQNLFSFGSTATTTTSSTFNFGQAAPTATTTSQSNLFSFGATATSSSAPSFNFGAPASTAAPVFGQSTSVAAPAPIFGQTMSSAAPLPSLFGASSQTQASQPAFSISSIAAPTFGTSSLAAPSFGATAAPLPSQGGFNFGGAATSTSGGFQFGGSGTSTGGALNLFTSGSQPASQAFAFGGTAPPPTGSGAPFQFNAATPASAENQQQTNSGLFTAGTTAGTRKIIAARRRTKRK